MNTENIDGWKRGITIVILRNKETCLVVFSYATPNKIVSVIFKTHLCHIIKIDAHTYLCTNSQYYDKEKVDDNPSLTPRKVIQGSGNDL